MSSSSNQPIDTTGSHDVTQGSHDSSDDRAHRSDGPCDSSDDVTTETDEGTIVQERTDLSVEKGVSRSHDSKDDSTPEESSHDPDRSSVLNKIYQKYIRDRKRVLETGHKLHRQRKKKV